MELIKKETYSSERSLYNIKDTEISFCTFYDEKNIAESPLKECEGILVHDSVFKLRYPLWHVSNSTVNACEFFDTSRAAFWYDKKLVISNSKLNGIKALRECTDVIATNCEANSLEFGWRCSNLSIDNFTLVSEYPFFETANLAISKIKMKGKYSFQYCKNVVISDSILDTKDAFWHADNVVVKNSVINGEYIGWYSNHLTFINCKISGTQPFCYCNKLKLIDCELIDADLAFEYSSVKATLKGKLISVKNPRKGYIYVDKIDEVIFSNSKYKSKCKLITK